MGKEYSVLIIDDHPLIVDSYRYAFEAFSKKKRTPKVNIEIIQDSDSALLWIDRALKGETRADLVMLDIKLPPSSDGEILSGEDLGDLFKKLLPDTKKLVCTTYNDNYRVHNIMKNLNPEGFLVKNDITPQDLLTAIETVINNPPYYSQTVIQMLRKQIANDFVLDSADRKILYELSTGTRMKDIPKVIPLSMAGIERRKRHLKKLFNVKDEPDRVLIKEAKEKGFI